MAACGFVGDLQLPLPNSSPCLDPYAILPQLLHGSRVDPQSNESTHSGYSASLAELACMDESSR